MKGLSDYLMLRCLRKNEVSNLKTRALIKKLIVSTGISILLFALICVLSYFLSHEYRVSFKIGLPWTFYDQFLVDCDVHHGTSFNNLILDALVIWLLTFGTNLFFYKKEMRIGYINT